MCCSLHKYLVEFQQIERAVHCITLITFVWQCMMCAAVFIDHVLEFEQHINTSLNFKKYERAVPLHCNDHIFCHCMIGAAIIINACLNFNKMKGQFIAI